MNAVTKHLSIEHCPHAASFADIIRHWAAVTPSAPVLACPKKETMSYGHLTDLMAHLSGQLVEAGFAPGHRLALLHRGGPDAITTLFGIMCCATAVPLNPDLSADELEERLHGCRVDGVLVEATLKTAVRKVAAKMDLPIIEIMPGKITDPAGHVSLDIPNPAKEPFSKLTQSEDIACVFGTSGTTSAPKIVPIRHRQLLSLSQSTALLYELTPADRSLNQNRLFLAGGIYNTCAALYSGGSVCFLESDDKTDLNAFFRGLTTLRPTWFVASFNFNVALDTYLQTKEGAIGDHSLRFIRVSSGRIEKSVAISLERFFGVPVIEAYSSTESGRICGNPMPPQKRKHGTVGLQCLNSAVRILDDEGHPVPTGQSGEVVIRGAHVFDGYENSPAENEASFIDGWYRTGDLGVFDEDGYLTLIGRIKEMINRGGEKIAPGEIDEILNAHPLLADAAAFAIPHRTLGEIVGAALVPMPNTIISEQDIAQFAEERLLPIKVPRSFVFVEQIPRGPSGKIKRHLLSELARQVMPSDALAVNRPVVPVDAFDTLSETTLFALWQKILKSDAIAPDDDFFMLGGDSLTATQLVLAVNDLFRIDMQLEWVFHEAKTIRTMAAKIDELRSAVHTVGNEIDLPMAAIDNNIPANAQSAPKEDVGNKGSTGKADANPGPFILNKETGVRGLRPNWTIASVVSNSHGLRSPEIPVKKPVENIRVAFLGDSLTFGSWDAGNEETWPHHTIMALSTDNSDTPFDYLNASMPGNGVAHVRQQVKQFLPNFTPDVITLCPGGSSNTNALARRRLGFTGVHYKSSRWSELSPKFAWIEKNLVIFFRQLRAVSDRGRLIFAPGELREMSTKFEQELEELVVDCQAFGTIVVLLTRVPRMRREQSKIRLLLNAGSRLYYQPYMSICAILDITDELNRIYRDVAARTGTLLADVTDLVPGTSEYYSDSSHYNAAGNRIVGEQVGRVLLKDEAFQKLVQERAAFRSSQQLPTAV